MTERKAVFAGGCFWGMQDLFRKLPGVITTDVGYTGGDLANPTYNDVKKGNTGHAESLRIVYDDQVISYRSLLEFFFRIHDPTTLNRQGNDIGTQYRSAIFIETQEEADTARDLIREMTESKRWPGPIRTEIVRAHVFTRAEEFHQDYLEKNPGGYTCHWVRPDWVLQS